MNTGTFHRLRYAEADIMRERVTLAASRTPLSVLGWARIHTERLRRREPSRGAGPRCRLCGERIAANETAICFMFAPLATNDDLGAGSLIGEAWLHREPCATEGS